MIFSKKKMIDRITKEGRADMLDEKSLAIMDNLDGCEGNPHNWQHVVNDAPVLWVIGKDGKGEYVNIADCE